MKRFWVRMLAVLAVSGWIAQSAPAQDNLDSSSTAFNQQTRINTWTPPSGHQTSANYGSMDEILITPRYPQTFFHLGEGVTIPVTERGQIDTLDFPAPAAAAPFINEPFYPHLTALIGKTGVPRSLQKRLSAFQKQRDAAATALWSQLAAMESLSASDADAAWAEFEREHASVWNQIDRERASLLSRFQAGGFMKPGVNLKDALSLVESADVDATAVPLVSLAVIRHFVTSLSMEQRDILGEIMHDLLQPEPTSRPSATEIPRFWEQQLSHAAMTDDQAAALSAYFDTKNELKRELVDTLLLFVPIDERNRETKTASARLFSSDPRVVRESLHELIGTSDFVLNWKKLESAAAQLRKRQAPKFEQMRSQWEELVRSLDGVAIEAAAPHSAALADPAYVNGETIGLLTPASVRLLNYATPGS